MIDLLMYQEALAACGWSVIRTDDLEKLRNASIPFAVLTNENELLNIENGKLRADLAAVQKQVKVITEFLGVWRNSNSPLSDALERSNARLAEEPK